MSILAPSLMLVGLGCLGLGWAWNSLLPSSAYWGPKEAEEYTKAQVDLHSTIDGHGHGKNHEHDAAAARERFNKVHEQLEQARGSRDGTSKYLTIAGVLALVAGIGFHLVTKESG